MTLRAPDPGFFVGYFKKVPVAIRRFVLIFGAAFIVGLASASTVLSLSAANPGPGAFVNELKDGHLTGIIEARPYPILRVPAANGQPARAVMIAGQGKTGMQDAAAKLDGQWADAGGIFVKRGDLDMLLIGGKTRLRAAAETPAATAALPEPVPLGRWRLTGEICDGKCYGGAMRPGNGLAHKACANLCITGGVPPVFVTTSPVEGQSFLLMAGADGGPLPMDYLDRTAVLLELEGTVERRDDLLIFKVDGPAEKEGKP